MFCHLSSNHSTKKNTISLRRSPRASLPGFRRATCTHLILCRVFFFFLLPPFSLSISLRTPLCVCVCVKSGYNPLPYLVSDRTQATPTLPPTSPHIRRHPSHCRHPRPHTTTTTFFFFSFCLSQWRRCLTVTAGKV